MTKLEAILEQAKGLSRFELEDLLRELSAYALDNRADDEADVGKRGLNAWTESTKGEDWSAYYPDSLRNGGCSHP
ncbi:MAG: hypothetical protein HY287_17585 [Planctomycetes bacterium]|nr:hypothetical protein [Planctomycetota bacterium]